MYPVKLIQPIMSPWKTIRDFRAWKNPGTVEFPGLFTSLSVWIYTCRISLSLRRLPGTSENTRENRDGLVFSSRICCICALYPLHLGTTDRSIVCADPHFFLRLAGWGSCCTGSVRPFSTGFLAFVSL